MMNSDAITGAITSLARKLRTKPIDEVIRRTYLSLLGRPPTPREIAVIKGGAKDGLSIAELLWVLINSAEFNLNY